ncbi:SH3 domain-containing protein [Streptomyces sp. S1D4-11]|nr:SH3 domain-containing protein [Streptomyces sp. S1D4-11]QIY98043.1 SH3 domain-containing protein [Streptomyces sp. S1D4-11]
MIGRTLRNGLVAAIAAVAVFPVTAVASAAPAAPHVPARGAASSPVASSSWFPASPQSSIPGLQRASHALSLAPRHHHKHYVITHAHHHARHVLGRVTTHHTRLRVRSGPGTGYRVVGSRRAGRVVTLVCKKNGSSVMGNSRWYKLANGRGYVSAHYVRNSRAVRWC